MSRIKAGLRCKRSCQYMVQLDAGLSGRVFSHSSTIKGPLDEQQLSLFPGVCCNWILMMYGLLHFHALMIDELRNYHTLTFSRPTLMDRTSGLAAAVAGIQAVQPRHHSEVECVKYLYTEHA